MEDQASSKSIILNNGLYYGLILVLTSVITYALGMHLDPTAGYINLAILVVILIAFPIIGLSKFKKANGGFMSWSQGVKIGIGIILIGTLISIIYQHLFTSFIEPDFYKQVEEITRTTLLDGGLSEEQIDSQLSMQGKFQGTIMGDALSLLFMTFIGFIVSAIVAAVKKHTEEDAY